MRLRFMSALVLSALAVLYFGMCGGPAVAG